MLLDGGGELLGDWTSPCAPPGWLNLGTFFGSGTQMGPFKTRRVSGKMRLPSGHSPPAGSPSQERCGRHAWPSTRLNETIEGEPCRPQTPTACTLHTAHCAPRAPKRMPVSCTRLKTRKTKLSRCEAGAVGAIGK